MENIASLLRLGAGELDRAGIPEPRREASSLMEISLARDRTFIFAHPEYEPSVDEAARYRENVRRRAAREPFHYIKGEKECYGLDFAVSPAVLIPRPETEMLVESVVRVLSKTITPVFCEIGVGSGCISIAALSHLPDARAVGLEISAEALAVAEHNASRHGVGQRFDLRRSDLFEALADDERFEIIVSNPPYVPFADLPSLQPEVREHEPISALTDGTDGLSIIRKLVDGSPEYLKPGGMLLMEIGIGQAEAVRQMLPSDIWRAVSIDHDFQNIPRVVSAVLAGK